MDVIMAIAMLCQVNAGFRVMKSVDQYQLSCQKYYIDCYYGKERKSAELFQTPVPEPKKFLFECISERSVR